MNNIFLESEFKSFGTDIYIKIVFNNNNERKKALEDIKEIKGIYTEKERILSRFSENSDLSKINHNLGRFIKTSEDIICLAKKSMEYFEESNGLFDPRILEFLEKVGYKKDFKENNFNEDKNLLEGNKIKKDLKKDLKIDNNRIMFLKKMDFAGIAKGYVTDIVVDFLKNRGWQNFLVDSGGDMYAAGKNQKGKMWNISLESAANEDVALIKISNEGIATSGITRKKWKIKGGRVHHIINPKKINIFNFNIKSVSVVEKSTERADVLAKIIFLMGIDSGIEFSNKNKIKSVFLLEDNNLIFSKNFK